MDYRKKIRSLILLILIINTLTIARLPIRDFNKLQSEETESFRTKLLNRYEPLLPLLGPERRIGHFVEQSDQNDDGLTKYARYPMLRYVLAPRNVINISDRNFFKSDEKKKKDEWNSKNQPDVVIYEGIPENQILNKHPAFIKVSETLYILK